MVNVYQIFGKVLFKQGTYLNDPLPVLQGNEQDLSPKT